MAARSTSWQSDIVRHSGIYMFAAACSRLASFVLLPVYMRHLSPADYGVMAVLELFTQILAILFVIAVAQAASRYHFDSDDAEYQASVWWTALLFLVGTSAPVWIVGVLAADPISVQLVGSEVPNRSTVFILALACLWWDCVFHLLLNYVRVKKRSWFYTASCLSRLLLAVVLNIWFVAYLKLGVSGVFLGLLIANTSLACILLLDFVARAGYPRIKMGLMRDFAHFGGPLILTGLLGVLIQQSDRFLLRLFADMSDVGVFSLAHKVSHAVNTLLLFPFSAIWSVIVYELVKRPDADVIYATVYRHFVTVLLMLLLGIALIADPLVGLLASDSFGPAAGLIPILCLGCFFYSTSLFFALPAQLERKTSRLLPASILAAVTSILGNCLVIPRYGAMGAAWVSTSTYFVYALLNYAFCRPIRPIPYPVGGTLTMLMVAVLTFGAYYSMLVAFDRSWLVSAACICMLGVFGLMVMRSPAAVCWRQMANKSGVN